MESQFANLTLEATLEDLPRLQHRVEVETPGAHVEKLFHEDSEAPGVLIYETDNAIGLLSRRRFTDILSRQFSREIYLKRPVRTILQSSDCALYVLPVSERIDAAVEKALTRHPDEVYKPIAVNGIGEDLGVLSIDLLLRAQSHILALANAQKGELLEEIRLSERNLRQTLEQLERAQDQLIQSEKMAALGQLVAGVAHEINTPIGIALTAISFLAEQTTGFGTSYRDGQMKKSTLEAYLRTAHDSSELVRVNIHRAAELISSFKQVAVDQTSERQREFLMRDFLGELLTSLNPEFKRTRHAVEVICPDQVKMRSYPGALAQVVTNLVTNAQLHAFSEEQHGRICIDVTAGSEDVAISIVDDGKGIPEDVLPRIFEPFFTTRRGSGGTGLGLHIIYNLIREELCGTINVESVLGQGTRFVVTIPRVLPESGAE